VNLENRLIKIRCGLIPNGELVAEIDEKTLDLDKKFTFAILGNGNCCFISIEDICEVDSFDDLE